MTIAIFSAFAFLSAVLAIRAYFINSERQKYIFKPLPIVLIIALIFFKGFSFANSYQILIVPGLLFSLAGDVLLISPKYFLPGLGAFLLAHFCYVAAFAHWLQFSSIFTALPFAVYVLIFLRILCKTLNELKIPVVIYALTIGAMGWLAVDRSSLVAANANLFAAVGALFSSLRILA